MTTVHKSTALLISSVVALVASTAVTAQVTPSTKTCQPVTVRNPQEAVWMESSAGKDGCWVRTKDKDGKDGPLVFISDTAPDKNHPPLKVAPAPRPPALPSTTAPAAAASGWRSWLSLSSWQSWLSSWSSGAAPIGGIVGTWGFETDDGNGGIKEIAPWNVFEVIRTSPGTFRVWYHLPDGSRDSSNDGPFDVMQNGSDASGSYSGKQHLSNGLDIYYQFEQHGEVLIQKRHFFEHGQPLVDADGSVRDDELTCRHVTREDRCTQCSGPLHPFTLPR